MAKRVAEWMDDFDGPAGDSPASHWTAELGGGGWGCEQLQRYTAPPANAALDGGGCLAITARRSHAEITSARLITKDRVMVCYGLVEARIRVPSGQGAWPAFWMLGSDIDDVGWPACGEIDVMEYVGSQPTTVHGTLHVPGCSGVGSGFGSAHDTQVELARDFHVYAVDWNPDRITWYMDGTPYAVRHRTDLPADAWRFDHDHYLLLNLAIGGNWPGNETDNPELPVTMLIDWIRIHGSVTLGLP